MHLQDMQCGQDTPPLTLEYKAESLQNAYVSLWERCEELEKCLRAGMSCSQSSSRCSWGSLAGSRRAEPVGICSAAAAAVRGMGENAAGDSAPLGSLTLPLRPEK